MRPDLTLLAAIALDHQVKTGVAAKVRLQLLRRGLLERDCASFGLAEVLEARRAEG